MLNIISTEVFDNSVQINLLNKEENVRYQITVAVIDGINTVVIEAINREKSFSKGFILDNNSLTAILNLHSRNEPK